MSACRWARRFQILEGKLRAFYEKYAPEKVDKVPKLAEKFVQRYGATAPLHAVAVCVRECVYVRACAHACVRECVYERECVRARVRACVRACVCRCVSTCHVCMRVCRGGYCMHVSAPVRPSLAASSHGANVPAFALWHACTRALRSVRPLRGVRHSGFAFVAALRQRELNNGLWENYGADLEYLDDRARSLP
jgi:hypothetical protein